MLACLYKALISIYNMSLAKKAISSNYILILNTKCKRTYELKLWNSRFSESFKFNESNLDKYCAHGRKSPSGFVL